MVADAAEVKAGNGIFAPFDGTPKAGAGQRLSYGNPRKSAEEFVFLLAGLSHQRALIRWRGDWYRWTGTYWRTVAEETLTMWLWEFLSRSQIAVATKGEETTKYTAEPFKPTKTRVGEVRSALAGLSSVLVPSAIEAPSWQEDGAGAHNLAHEYVALANGLLHLPTR